MKNNVTSPLNRRAFLTLGAGALCAFGLSGCSSKGSYDDGYAAGYAAAIADMEQQKASIPTSGIEYTINSVSIRTDSNHAKPFLVVYATAVNVSDEDATVSFGGSEIRAYQNGAMLDTTYASGDGLDTVDNKTVLPNTTVAGWMAYKLNDTTTPVEFRAFIHDGELFYGLTNPQTVDLSTL